MASLNDVARVAGVSTATISKYLNGVHVKETNKQKIDKAVKELNYQVNYVARGLKMQKTMTIGVLLPTFNSRFYPALVSILEKKLSAYGFNVLLCDYDNDTSLENNKFKLLMSRQVDQIVAVPMSLSEENIGTAERNNVPIIFFDHLPANGGGISIVINNADIAYRATRLLIERGRRKIALVTSHSAAFSMRERLRGCMQAFHDCGVTDDHFKIIETAGDSEDAYRKMLDVLTDRPDAVFALSSNNMIGSIMAIAEKELSVPEDIGFIGFDNSELSRLFRPPLTYIAQPTDEIAARIVDLIKRNAAGEQTRTVETITIDARLHITDSP